VRSLRIQIAHVSREAHDTAGGAPALPSPGQTITPAQPAASPNAMTTAHDFHEDIEPWLAASVHGQLSEEERQAFQKHLADCATCRALHAEELAMNNMIASTLDQAKPDLAFEQRVLSGFRKKVPHRAGLISLLASLLRFRTTQIAAAAAVLLTLVQVGRQITGEAAGPVEGPRQFPSFAGQAANANDHEAKDESTAAGENAPQLRERGLASGRVARTDTAKTSMPPANYRADALKSMAQSAAAPPPAPIEKQKRDIATDSATTERTIVAGSYIPTPEEENATGLPNSASNRKLVRNAQVELEVIKFDEAVQKITGFATEMRGYVATSSSEKQANGKLRGQVVVKVLPETLDAFLLKLRGLGELKNQTLGTDDVTKQYFDTDSRLKNARVMEQRLIDILKTKSSKVADLLEVEKELGRVRAQIEQMQGELKYMDAQVAFATVTITLAEKDMDVPAAFLLKRRAQLALFSTDVEKTFAEVKGVIDGAKAQISSSTLDRDSTGEATARLVLLIAPEEADALIVRIKGMGRVQNYNEQTDRVAQGGSGMGDNAKVKRDKVELGITISRNEQEPALQTTSLRILTGAVTDKVAQLKENASKSGAEIRSSSFSRSPDGQEFANVSLRVPMKNYPALMSSFNQLGKVKDVSVQRDDRRGTINEATAPADINIQVYTQADIVSDESGLFATIRRTLMQGASALMWSLRMIGVALAFFAPWVLAIAFLVWIVKRVARARKARRHPNS
jgi:anti-sigma factor RsiW